VVYVDVTTFGEDVRECGRRLKLGSGVGLAGGSTRTTRASQRAS
jgi:hypothetical protein